MLLAGDEEGLDPKDDDMFEPSTYKVFFKPPAGYAMHTFTFSTPSRYSFA